MFKSYGCINYVFASADFICLRLITFANSLDCIKPSQNFLGLQYLSENLQLFALQAAQHSRIRSETFKGSLTQAIGKCL